MDSGTPALLERISDSLTRGNRVFLSGPAGTGKTWLVKRIARKIAERGKVVFVTASTGIAASLLFDEIGIRQSFYIQGPSTLHSAAMLPWSSEDDDTHFVELGKRSLAGADVLIIDEVSMLDSRTFGRLLTRVCDYTGILVVGDLYQLPPVARDEENRPDFVFYNEGFTDFQLVELTKNHRQTEPEFLSFLDALRHGRNQTDFYLSVESEFDSDHPALFGTRREAGFKNAKELSKLPGKLHTSRCDVTVGDRAKALRWFENYTRALQTCEFKEGMRVLCIQNHNDLVNGDLGTLIGISGNNGRDGSPDALTIKFDRTRIGSCEVKRYRFKKEVQDSQQAKVKFCVEQFPIVPAYGLTVHKAQGLTLDAVNIDGRRVNFASGQVYVAVSRCRAKRGLRIRNPHMFHAFTRESVEDYYGNADRLQLGVQT